MTLKLKVNQCAHLNKKIKYLILHPNNLFKSDLI